MLGTRAHCLIYVLPGLPLGHMWVHIGKIKRQGPQIVERPTQDTLGISEIPPGLVILGA